jgi:aminopeptidase N
MKKNFVIELLLVILNLNTLLYASNISHSYDVLNYKLNLNIYDCFKPPYTNSFIAIDQITFKVDSILNFIDLDAVNRSLTIDSVKLVNSIRLYFSHTQNILAVSLDRIYYPGEVVNIGIYYRHNNVNDSDFHVSDGLVYTEHVPEGARCWFPCWDKPSDKATSDITAKVPSNVLLGSNGSLVDSAKIADTIYYRWVSRDPMATYLIAITGCIAYQLDVGYWHKLSNPTDSIPVRYYFKYPEDISKIRDSLNLIMNLFSSYFGDYEFEKIGFASTDSLEGGMENQTLIFLNPNHWNQLISVGHEMAHQWFGDLITCGTWADVWLNESFAKFSEALILEYTQGITGYRNSISFDSNYYFSWGSYSEPIYNASFIDNTPPGEYLYDYAVRYCKGACVLHMLRNILGDSVFFNVLHSYATDTNFTFKNAVTDDFTAKLNQVTGQDYTWFINEWVKQPGHPVYQNTYNSQDRGNNNWRVNFFGKQTLQYTTFHAMPIEIKVHFTNSTDTLLKVFNNSNNQLFTFDFNKQPDSLKFDPDNKIILKQGTTTIGIIKISEEIPIRFSLSQNYPNPFNPGSKIKFQIAKLGEVQLKIYDILGRKVATLVNEKLSPGTYEVEWDASDYSSGVYFYRLTSASDASSATGGPLSITKRMVLIK